MEYVYSHIYTIYKVDLQRYYNIPNINVADTIHYGIIIALQYCCSV